MTAYVGYRGGWPVGVWLSIADAAKGMGVKESSIYWYMGEKARERPYWPIVEKVVV